MCIEYMEHIYMLCLFNNNFRNLFRNNTESKIPVLFSLFIILWNIVILCMCSQFLVEHYKTAYIITLIKFEVLLQYVAWNALHTTQFSKTVYSFDKRWIRNRHDTWHMFLESHVIFDLDNWHQQILTIELHAVSLSIMINLLDYL